MPTVTDRQTRSRRTESESGTMAETQEATGGEATQEAAIEATQENTTMRATQEDGRVHRWILL